MRERVDPAVAKADNSRRESFFLARSSRGEESLLIIKGSGCCVGNGSAHASPFGTYGFAQPQDKLLESRQQTGPGPVTSAQAQNVQKGR